MEIYMDMAGLSPDGSGLCTARCAPATASKPLTITGVLVLMGLAIVILAVKLGRPFLEELRRFVLLFRLPHPPGEPFLLGSAMAMRRKDHHRVLRNFANKLGGIFAFRVATLHFVVVVDAELVNQLLGPGESLSKALEPSNSDKLFAQRPGHHTIFSSDTGSPYWRLIRKGTAPAFKADNIKKSFPGMVSIINQVIGNMSSMPPGSELDINNVTLRLALDINGLVAFGKQFGATSLFADDETNEVFGIMKKAARELYMRGINPLRPLMFWDRDVRGCPALFESYRARMRALVQEVKARGAPAPGDTSVAAHLLRLRDPVTNEPLADDLLAGEFGFYFMAGVETTGNSITWTLYEISRRPEVEAKVMAELDQAGLLAKPGRPHPRALELDDLGRLPYLSWASKEAMRIRPAASTGVTRVAKRDLRLGGYLIPRGSTLLVPFDAVHHYAGNWADPDAFIPERWAEPGADLASSRPAAKLDTRASDATLPGAQQPKRFLPFSTGPRQCIAFGMARVMHDAAVASILAHFALHLAPRMGGPAGVDAKEINRLTLQPEAGMWMTFTHRARG